MASAARRKRLKEAGCCSQCTQPPVPGRSRCQKHLEKANELARRRNAERKAYGLCIRCPNKATEGHVLCQTCLDNLRRRDINWDGKRAKEATKAQLRRAAGLCKWCDNPIVPGRALCDSHLTQEREKVRAYRAERRAKGLCWRCDEPVRKGGVLCQAHREQVTAKERKSKKEEGAGSPVEPAPDERRSQPVNDRRRRASRPRGGLLDLPEEEVHDEDFALGAQVVDPQRMVGVLDGAQT